MPLAISKQTFIRDVPCADACLLAGVYGAFLTGDIFNLYVWFEVMLIASFGLMVLDANKYQIDGAVIHVIEPDFDVVFCSWSVVRCDRDTNLADLHAKAALIPSDTKPCSLVCSYSLFPSKQHCFPCLFSAFLPHYRVPWLLCLLLYWLKWRLH